MYPASKLRQKTWMIEEHQQSSEPIILCRFLLGVLVKESVDFHRAEYIAFSHVWGKADCTNVRGIADQIIVSQSKARFLEQTLQRLVGNSYIWIDVLCIDQTNVEERIKVTAIIPEIYNRFKSCCARVFGQLAIWADYDAGLQRWSNHWVSDHENHLLYEGILERLWPLQESVLSNNIQFVTCEEELGIPLLSFGFDGVYMRYNSINANMDRLWTLSRAWVSYGKTTQVSGDEQLSFIYALLNNGEGGESLIQSNSTRKTTKARDLILSTMSQYDWYSAPSPQQVRQMGFGRLFRDCFAQARRANCATLPKITGGMVGEDGDSLETSNIPEPEYLGDLVKLFGLATECAPRDDSDCASGIDLGPVTIRAIDSNDIVSTLRILKRSLEFSRSVWQFARKGELSLLGTWPDDQTFSEGIDESLCQNNAMKFLNLMVIGFFDGGGARADSDSFKRDLINANPSNYSNALIRFGALISCGIGVSAFEWSKKVWTPVLVAIGKHEILGMISSPELNKKSIQDENYFHLAHPLSSNLQITYRHMVITCPEKRFKPRHRCIGLLPEFFSEYEDKQTFLRRRDELRLNEVGVMVNLI